MTFKQKYTEFYNAWQNMKRRCNNPNIEHYEYYGGKGVTYDKEWESIDGFKVDMLPTWKKGLTLDRIDVDGNYQKDNCRWITMKEQCYNRTNNRYITIDGETKALTEWSELSGVPVSTIHCRVDRGVSGVDLIQKNPRPISLKQSGVQGIIWNKNIQKWIINVRENGKKKRIGSFEEKDLDSAIVKLKEYQKLL